VNWFKSFWKKLNAPPAAPVARAQSTSSNIPKGPVQPSVAAGPTHRPPTAEETASNFTPRAQRVLALARQEANRFNHNFVGTEHLLLGLIRLDQGTAVNALQKMGLDLNLVRGEVEKQVGTGPEQKMVGKIPYTPRVKKVIAMADKERKALNHTYLGTEHLLLGLLREGDGVAARVLKNLGVDIEKTRDAILVALDPKFIPTPRPRPPENPPSTISAKPITPLNSHRQLLDTTARYDVYCAERNLKTVVYRNVLIKAVKTLFPRNDFDQFSDFVELERADGQTVFVAKSTVFRFCHHGINPNAEDLSGESKEGI
jgi:hypothetical protein